MNRRQSNSQRSGSVATHPGPNNSECKIPPGKFLTSIFWDQDGFIAFYCIDYCPKGQNINAEYYSSLLVQLKDILKESAAEISQRWSVFLHDNAQARRALATQKKLAYLDFHFLDHPRYSPNRVPSNYHLFPGMKKTIER